MNTQTVTYTDHGYPITTTHGVLCGCCGHHHQNPAAVRECHDIAREQAEAVEACRQAELACERHLEDRGYDAARAQDDFEASMGVIPFHEAMAAALAC